MKGEQIMKERIFNPETDNLPLPEVERECYHGADKSKSNMMEQTIEFFKNLYLQNKDEIDKIAKEEVTQ